ncbi:hypothetical protein ACQFX9_05385 [Aliinostoc sp. HNIBRCY26]|uniref:hypothetical protein n=1 Tax=Aliinostoc sp. HNIBRCY26 TaxID=3418997 RepID=UPI003D021245
MIDSSLNSNAENHLSVNKGSGNEEWEKRWTRTLTPPNAMLTILSIISFTK